MDTSFSKPKPAYITGIIVTMLLLTAFSFIHSPAALHFLGQDKMNAAVYFISRLLYWLCLALLGLYAAGVEKQQLLLWKNKSYKPHIAILSGIAIIAAFFVGNIIAQLLVNLFKSKEESSTLAGLVTILQQNIPLLLFTAVTAGITEELIFRGYMLPRLLALFKKPYIAIFISAVLFAAMHYRYGTLINMAGPFMIGIVCGIYYYKFRNIGVIIACHIIWDLLALYTLIHHR